MFQSSLSQFRQSPNHSQILLHLQEFCFTLMNLKNTNSSFLLGVFEEKSTLLFPDTVLQAKIICFVCFPELRHSRKSYMTFVMCILLSQIRSDSLSHCYWKFFEWSRCHFTLEKFGSFKKLIFHLNDAVWCVWFLLHFNIFFLLNILDLRWSRRRLNFILFFLQVHLV